MWFWIFRRENVASFSNLNAALEKNKFDLDAEPTSEIEAHLQSLKQEFERRFSYLANTDLPEWKLARNFFRAGLFPDKIQEELLKLKYSSVPVDDFKTMPLNDFWAKNVRVDRNIGNVLPPFSATYGPTSRLCRRRPAGDLHQ